MSVQGSHAIQRTDETDNLYLFTAAKENYATYKFNLNYENCGNNANVEQLIDELEETVMEYGECMLGYYCDLSDTEGTCNSGKASVSIVIKVYCDTYTGKHVCLYEKSRLVKTVYQA